MANETIEELQLKLEILKLEEKSKLENKKIEFGKQKLEEKKADRLSREVAATNRLNAKIQQNDANTAFINMVIEFQTKNHIYYDESKRYWAWNWANRTYESCDDTTVMVRLTQMMGIRIIDGHEKFKFLESVRQEGRIHPPKDLPPYCIQFKDKVININNGKEFLASPDCMFTSSLPYNLGSSTNTPIIDKLISEWVHKDNILTVFEIMAYCMYKKYPIHKEFFFVGSGRNGKSQLLKLITNFVGDKNTVSTDLNDIANNQFEGIRLLKKSLAIIAETDNNIIKNTKILKAITSGDTIKGEGKGKDGFDFVNYAKIIIASNDLPETLDKSDGFYRRASIIDFPNKFKDTGNPIIEAIPKEEYENLGLKLIPILKNLLKRGSFHNEGTIENKRARFEAKSNPILEFISQSYIYDINGKVLMDDFKINLEGWLIKRKIAPIKMNGHLFNLKITNTGLKIEREKQEGKHILYIYGLTYKKIEEFDPDVNPFDTKSYE